MRDRMYQWGLIGPSVKKKRIGAIGNVVLFVLLFRFISAWMKNSGRIVGGGERVVSFLYLTRNYRIDTCKIYYTLLYSNVE
jgi:hypothetical protein